jgi:hypothetical protein
MQSLFSPRTRRQVSRASIVLLLFSLGWSVSAEAFNDWLGTETAAASQESGKRPCSSPCKPAMKDACNGGCHALSQLLGLSPGEITVAVDDALGIGETGEFLALFWNFSDPPYHPPRRDERSSPN